MQTLAGAGTWSLLPKHDGLGDIHHGFDEARFSRYLSISSNRTKPWLYWYIGDPDSCQINASTEPDISCKHPLMPRRSYAAGVHVRRTIMPLIGRSVV
jgi:hypothetical protein